MIHWAQVFRDSLLVRIPTRAPSISRPRRSRGFRLLSREKPFDSKKFFFVGSPLSSILSLGEQANSIEDLSRLKRNRFDLRRLYTFSNPNLVPRTLNPTPPVSRVGSGAAESIPPPLTFKFHPTYVTDTTFEHTSSSFVNLLDRYRSIDPSSPTPPTEKLTPHYQQQVEQSTSHFPALPSNVFIIHGGDPGFERSLDRGDHRMAGSSSSSAVTTWRRRSPRAASLVLHHASHE